MLLVFLFMNFIYVVTFSRSTTTEDREWWARSAGWILVTALAWALASAVVLWGPIGLQVLLQDRSWIKTVVAAMGGATGIATALLGYSTRSAAVKKEGARSGSWLVLGAIVFLVFLLVYIAFATSWLEAKFFGVSTAAPVPDDYRYPVDYRGFFSTIVLQMEVWKILLLAAAFCVTGLLVGFLVNVNQFSLHAMYNARLTRAYLGASRAGRGRAAHWFTGFDQGDKIRIVRTRAALAIGAAAQTFSRHQLRAQSGQRKGTRLAGAEGAIVYLLAAALRQLAGRLPRLGILRWRHWPRDRDHHFRRGG